MLARTAAAGSLVLVAAGLVGFFADPLRLPAQLLDVLDKRASVLGMFVGIAGLLVAGVALWAQLRPPGTPPPASDPPAGGGPGPLVVHLPPRPPVPVRPVRLAPRPPRLAGRDEALAGIRRRLDADAARPALLVVHGLGGVGKTSLVAEYAHRHQDTYHLMWQLPAEDPAVLSAAFAGLAALLGLRPPGETADPVRQVHAALAAHPGRWLLILDNAPDPEAVHDVLPPAGDGHVLVTSRSGHWPSVQSMELPALDGEPAAAFLVERTGQDDPAAAAAVAAALGGLPLALEQAGAYITAAGTTLAGYLELLRRRRAEVLAQGRPWGYDQQVASTWQLSFDHLAADAPRAIALLRLLACYAPDDIPYRLLLGAPKEGRPAGRHRGRAGKAGPRALPAGELEVDAAVSALRRHGLVGRPAGGMVSVHRLVQAVTLHRLPARARTAWHRTAATLLLAALPGAPDDPAGWPRYTLLLPHARVALPRTLPELHLITEFLGRSGDHRTATALGREVCQALAAELGTDHPRTIGARHDLALWTGLAGDAGAARDQFAALIPVCERVLGAEHPHTLTTRDNLAAWTGKAGDATAARDRYTALVPIRERLLGPDHPDTLISKINLAQWTGEAGDATAARDRYAALLPVCERVLGPEHPHSLAVRNNLAGWTGLAGDAIAARDRYTALLPVHERVLGPDHPETLVTRSNVAHWTGLAGDPATARDRFTALLPDFERVLGPDHPDTLTVRRNLADWTENAGGLAPGG
ncbi:hypothetical protein Sru01_47740 [Sphaerisporangium rufum]|uniref:Tetratricopeptide repeat-containing protein n=1 Tax=Sphaerisporangium rufum TaxID=1381558 RepID=A0A919R9J8_9ACTN|nr:FxSxx-COOH system tetratricopeptide repeat protein [Sphaerisporangium rufum]GII79792.1 hypothetical protein Sru01_47740 [Sphaerisporangium rufum]